MDEEPEYGASAELIRKGTTQRHCAAGSCPSCADCAYSGSSIARQRRGGWRNLAAPVRLAGGNLGSRAASRQRQCGKPVGGMAPASRHRQADGNRVSRGGVPAAPERQA
ncbi:hypothetical protein [Paenibacillus sambharensis]|uniref:hypothetical protein n=1 Tax=Paenibacillus sambharensis TaxID=1803190 RepID=UPI0011B66B4F|nr:hypothetical protein [Paenibacillus sambharensis]